MYSMFYMLTQPTLFDRFLFLACGNLRSCRCRPGNPASCVVCRTPNITSIFYGKPLEIKEKQTSIHFGTTSSPSPSPSSSPPQSSSPFHWTRSTMDSIALSPRLSRSLRAFRFCLDLSGRSSGLVCVCSMNQAAGPEGNRTQYQHVLRFIQVSSTEFIIIIVIIY